MSGGTVTLAYDLSMTHLMLPTHPIDRQTHACENITFLQLPLRAVKSQVVTIFCRSMVLAVCRKGAGSGQKKFLSRTCEDTRRKIM